MKWKWIIFHGTPDLMSWPVSVVEDHNGVTFSLFAPSPLTVCVCAVTQGQESEDTEVSKMTLPVEAYRNISRCQANFVNMVSSSHCRTTSEWPIDPMVRLHWSPPRPPGMEGSKAEDKCQIPEDVTVTVSNVVEASEIIHRFPQWLATSPTARDIFTCSLFSCKWQYFTLFLSTHTDAKILFSGYFLHIRHIVSTFRSIKRKHVYSYFSNFCESSYIFFSSFFFSVSTRWFH